MEHWDLIAKFLKNEASEEEITILNSWRNESSENEKLFLEIKSSWKKVGEYKADAAFDKKKAWKNIQNKIQAETKVVPLNAASKSPLGILLRIAAVFVIGLFAAWAIYNSMKAPEQLFAVTGDTRTEIKLADGSIVWLNKNSSLNYPEAFSGNNRTVRVTGEAYFDIAKNPDMPFVIENAEFEVKVLGTSFNIFSYEKEEEIIVSVTSGKVLLKNKTDAELILTKDETGVINRKNKNLSKKDTDQNFLSWKDQKLEFNNTPFSTVCLNLKSYFGFDFVVENKEINNCRLTASFTNPKIEEVLDVLQNTLNIGITKNQKQIVISGKGC
jgi:ferric-dicitrate binding protein FerR (iron transport regulator)